MEYGLQQIQVYIRNVWKKTLLRICTVNSLPIAMSVPLLKFQSSITHLGSGRLLMPISVLSPSLFSETFKHNS